MGWFTGSPSRVTLDLLRLSLLDSCRGILVQEGYWRPLPWACSETGQVLAPSPPLYQRKKPSQLVKAFSLAFSMSLD